MESENRSNTAEEKGLKSDERTLTLLLHTHKHNVHVYTTYTHTNIIHTCTYVHRRTDTQSLLGSVKEVIGRKG